ncbi:MAG TPA: hypothetical protein VFI44_02875, partial [Ornithinibacter sp.]|nr:hypothetical protein [Ornithinibacter sp.]
GIGALGIIGAGGRADRGYVAVLLVLAVGTALARLRPRGMSIALLATALTQVLVPVVVLAADVPGTEGTSVVDVVGLTAMYAGLFCASAWLFRRAADQRSRVAPASHS